MVVGGFGDGSIQLIDQSLAVSYLSEPGANGMLGTVGMTLDEDRGRLWVANFGFDVGDGIPGSNLKIFDYTTGELTATVPETFELGVFFNELASDSSGKVYISDTLNPFIWVAEADLSGVELFVNDTLLLNPERPFTLNGLALSPDENYLIVSVMDRNDAGGGRLVSINVASRELKDVELTGTEAVAAFAGSDGMFFEDDMLFMVNLFSPAGAIITAEFSEGYSSAELTIRDAFQEHYDRPSASTINNGKHWTVNSQLDHIIDDENGALGTPPSLPFTVVGVPLEELLSSSEDTSTATKGGTAMTGSFTVCSLLLLALLY